MHDRAMQALYALALQLIAEADARSFGFRLFRSAQDECIDLVPPADNKNSYGGAISPHPG